MSSQPNPHDAVFRRVLGEPANAASQLRAVLPPALTERLDLARLVQVSGSYVDAALRWRHSDLLFRAPMDGREAFVYVLVEHQSRTDQLMPFRMLNYVVKIWDHYLEEHPEADRLPAVIPLVVHHNNRAWAAPTEILDLVDLDRETADAVRAHLPRFEFLLDDLSVVDQQTLMARPVSPPTRMTLLLLKIASGNRQLADDLRPWSDELRSILERPGGTEDFVALLTYIETVGEAPSEELHDLFAKLGTEAEETYVTTAEMLRAEGEARGEARGRTAALVQLLTLKFGQIPNSVLDTVHAASQQQLEDWTARVLTADTLDEVLH